MTGDRRICAIQCERGTAYSKLPGADNGAFYCDVNNGQWVPGTLTESTCKSGRPASAADVVPEMYYYTGACTQNHTEIRENFIQILNQTSVLQNLCGVNNLTCDIAGVTVSCFSTDKRSAGRHLLSDLKVWDVDFTIRIVPLYPETTLLAAINDLVNDLNDALWELSIDGSLDLPEELETTTTTLSYGYGATSYVCSGNAHARVTNEWFPICVGCGAGRVFTSSEEPCALCPVGTYQPEEEGNLCLPCPGNTTTRSSGAEALSDCLDLCPAGSVSVTGMQPICDPCPVGTFQAETGKAGCDECPLGSSTVGTGATSLDDCHFHDLVFTSTTSNWPRFEPTIDFTSMGFVCTPSDLEDTVTSFSLVNTMHPNAAFLGCQSLGVYIIQETNAALRNKRQCHHVAFVSSPSDPTINRRLYIDGVLHESNSLASVNQCSDLQLRFTPGAVTELRVNALQMANRVLSQEEIQEFAQSCDLKLTDNALLSDAPLDYLTSDMSCDATDGCENTPCGERGTCIDQQDAFLCHCDHLWSGDTCEIPPDFCRNHECQNHAICLNNIEGRNFSCDCTSDFRGPLCAEAIVHGQWGLWDEWSQCSAPCGTGRRNRTRACDNPPPDHDGRPCEGIDQEIDVACNTHPCPVDGGWTSWSPWNCSVTCDNGTAHRARSCSDPAPQHGGQNCRGLIEEFTTCEMEPCPLDGQYTEWSEWTQCTVTCGGGVTERERNCSNPEPAYGGRNCSEQGLGPAVEVDDCNVQDCPECPLLRRNTGQDQHCETNSTTEMEECTLSCQQAGYVVGDTVYTCGLLSNYTWSHVTEDNPNGLLPQCKKAETPAERTFTLSADMDIDDDTGGATTIAVTGEVQRSASSLVSDNSSAVITAEASPSKRRRKRESATTITITMNVESPSSGRDLTTATESERQEQMDASDDFESTAQTMAKNIGAFLNVSVGGVQYVANEDSLSDSVDFHCPEGLEASGSLCVECGPGTYWTNSRCLVCARNFYQNGYRATSCIPCPDGSSTRGLGSQSLEDCEEDGVSFRTENPSSSDDDVIIPVVASVCAVLLVAGIATAIYYIVHKGNKSKKVGSSQLLDTTSSHGESLVDFKTAAGMTASASVHANAGQSMPNNRPGSALGSTSMESSNSPGPGISPHDSRPSSGLSTRLVQVLPIADSQA